MQVLPPVAKSTAPISETANQREKARLLPKRPKSQPWNTETLDPTCFRQAYMLNLDA
ncbi:MAG: hypothetical protein RL015_946 [Verrucomicrobiota bacterium]|jgi:hypothetical protein